MNNNLIQNEEFLKIFEALVKEQAERAEKIKESASFVDYNSLDKIIIGTLPGDGIGPVIMDKVLEVLNVLLKDELASGRIEIRSHTIIVFFIEIVFINEVFFTCHDRILTFIIIIHMFPPLLDSAFIIYDFFPL